MAKKIFISPSNQTDNKYAYGNTTEAIQCGRIGEALQKALKRCGFETKLMQYYTMAERVASANSWGADLYMPIHTNAYNGSVSGTRMFSWDTSGAGYKACKAVYKYLAPLTIGTSESISAYPDLYEIKYPNAPTVYTEVDFHDVPSVAKWIIEHTDDIAEAMCKGVCEYFGVKYVAPSTTKPATPTTNTSNKVSVSMRVMSKGMSGNDVRYVMLILKDKGYYKVSIPSDDKTFGNNMDSAVRALQKAKGLTVDGVIGEKTYPYIFN